MTATNRRAEIPEAIADTRVLAIVRGLGPDDVDRVAEGVFAGGIKAIEVTLDSPDAAVSIARLVKRGVAVGAGTVLSVEEAAGATDAGASYLVTPGFDAAVVAWAVGNGVPVMPGAFTATEVMAAWASGASAVKLFPAEVGGPAYLKALKAPLRHIPIMTTGGVSAETAGAWLAAGALAVAAGGWLIGDGDPTGVKSRAEALVAAVLEAPRP